MSDKRCSVCRAEKPRDMFSKQSAARDGLQSRCRECSMAASKARYDADPTAERARKAAYRERNPEVIAAYERRNKATISARRASTYKARGGPADPDRDTAWRKSDRQKNPEKYRARIAKWQAENRHKVRANSSRRKARKLTATPAWANADKVSAFYQSADALCMLTGEWHHVDHIVPLQGRTVCGLHNEFNLQILTARENIAKSNRFWPDQP